MIKRPNQAILMAAGYGKRLGSLTKNTPKCLLPIDNANVLEHWLQKIDNAGIEHIIINTHYLADKVNTYLKSHRLRSRISVFHEVELMGTAGTLSALEDQIKGPFFFIHADNYSSVNLTDMINSYLKTNDDEFGTALVFETDNISGCGIFTLDENGRPINFIEKPKDDPSNLANGAVFILRQNIFEILKSDENAEDFSRDILPLIFKKISPFLLEGHHIDIGTPSNLRKAQKIAAIKIRDNK